MWSRFAVAWVAAIGLGIARPAAADVGDYVGKPIASVSVESGGRPIVDARLVDLIETRVGEPLAIAAVRQSITHLFSLGRYDDVRVHAAASGTSVAITYELVPHRTIRSVSFEGVSGAGVDPGRLRRLVTERFGVSPRPDRAPDIAAVVADDLKQRGYLRARVTTRIDASRDDTLVLTIAEGDRTRIGEVRVEGDAGMPVPEVLHQLRVERGSPFERESLNTRVDRYLADRRSHGYFAARATYSPELLDDDRTANLTLAFVPGPHVTVVFAGDLLPSDRRAELVSIAQEGSADEDILEDSSNRIEEYLRTQGYRNGEAPHTRQESAGELTITFTVKKGPLYRVGRVDFSGNSSISVTDLQARTRVRPGQPFSQAAIDADVTAVEDMYRRVGFAGVQTDLAVESEPPVGVAEVPVAIRMTIVEGVAAIVTSVRLDAGAGLPEADLRQGLSLQPGQPFSQSQLAADREAIQLRLANLGYQTATVTANPGLSADGIHADVVFTLHEGPQVFVDHVLIVGNERTRTSTIERELQFKSGKPLGLEQLNESQRRLAALGLFRRARITELGHGDVTRRDILVTVEEAPVATIGYGGGLEGGQRLRTEDPNGPATEHFEFAPRAFFEIGRQNLFGKNRSIGLFSRVSFRPQDSTDATSTTNTGGLGFTEYRVLGTFREPRVFNTSADAFVNGLLEQGARASFNFARRGLSAEVGRRLTPKVSVSGSYQIQRTELFDEQIDPEFRTPTDRLFPQVRLSSFSGSVIRDTRDDTTEPTAGRFVSVNGQLAARRIGSEVGFAKGFVSAQAFRIAPGTRRLVLAGSARLGVADGFPREVQDQDENGNPVFLPDGQPSLVTVDDVPASERFFAGGDTTVRGFALDQLGTPETIDKDGFPSGGQGLVILNAEARIPVYRGLGVVGFFDSGNVFARATDIRLAELRGAVGFGVRYKSPIGPIRVDVGFKLHRNTLEAGTREALTALHISLGQAF